jgi:hypothetical protein
MDIVLLFFSALIAIFIFWLPIITGLLNKISDSNVPMFLWIFICGPLVILGWVKFVLMDYLI